MCFIYTYPLPFVKSDYFHIKMIVEEEKGALTESQHNNEESVCHYDRALSYAKTLYYYAEVLGASEITTNLYCNCVYVCIGKVA